MSICIQCGINIPPQRLYANPKAVRCIKCQGEFEKTNDVRLKIDDIKPKIENFTRKKVKIKKSKKTPPK